MSKKYQARDDTNRNRKITVRFSEDEYDQINFICEVLGITYSQYLRRAALTRRIEHPTVYATFSDDAAQKLTGQMGKIGSNLNQIARKLNSGDPQTEQTMKSIETAIDQLNERMKFLCEVEAFNGDSQAFGDSRQ